jgi:4-hydroxythreonine-4-phosphate dehydrogenase
MSANAPVIAITPGDPEGIGPEVTWKALRQARGSFFCVGARAPFARLKAPVSELSPEDVTDRARLVKKLRSSRAPRVWLLPAPTEARHFLPGYQSGWSIEHATRLVQAGVADALVTGPISKERLQKGGYEYPGHTEFLAALASAEPAKPLPVTMMLANEKLRVSLVTIHLALSEVSKKISAEELRRAIFQTSEFLTDRVGIKKPRIAVAALNPHAGESGLFGSEDQKIIAPEIERIQSEELPLELSGPHPADTLFAKHLALPKSKRYDAVVCMYHDQGLVPVKLLDFKRTVNITLGLPFLRTSVDHGVGFDIAGKGIADPSSMRSAIALATRIASSKNASRK